MLKLPILLALTFLLVSCAYRKFGNYYNKNRYYGDMFILKEDSTFIYIRPGHTSNYTQYFDSSSGRYILLGDTLYLEYQSNLHRPYLNDNFSDSLEHAIINPFGYYGNRPQKMLWKGRRLYYITIGGDAVRSIDHKIQWGKDVGHYLYTRWCRNGSP
jgi:hypothetical protein